MVFPLLLRYSVNSLYDVKRNYLAFIMKVSVNVHDVFELDGQLF